MADSVELPIDFTNWQRFQASIEGTTKASKDLGETWKKALLGEVITGGIQRVGAALGGVAGEATNAAGAIVQGFFQGGPVGAAIAATAAGVGFLVNRFQEAEAAEKKWVESRAALWRAAREVGPAMQAAFAATNDAIAEIGRQRERDRVQAEMAADESSAKARADARKAAAKKALDDADTQAAEGLAALEKENADRRAAELAAFNDELDIEAEQAQRLRDAKDADAARAKQVQSDRDAEEVRLFNLKNQQIEDAARRVRAQMLADKKVADEAEAAADAARLDRVERDWAAVGATLSNGFTNNVGNAVQALAQLDAAQIQAALSSKDLGANLASSALEALQGVLASTAREAAVKSAFYFAEGLGALAGVATAPAAPGLFATSAAFAGVAALAGGGAIAAGTAASAVAPARPAAPAPSTRASAPVGTTPASPSGGVTIIVNSSRALVTNADVGASTDRALREYRRYAGTRS